MWGNNLNTNYWTNSVIPLLIAKLCSGLSKIFQCPLSPLAWFSVPHPCATICAPRPWAATTASHTRSWHTPQPAQSCWLPSPAEMTPGPPLQWSSSSAYNLFTQVPVGTHHFQHQCCICSILACLVQEVAGNRFQGTGNKWLDNRKSLQLWQGRFWLDTRKLFFTGL